MPDAPVPSRSPVERPPYRRFATSLAGLLGALLLLTAVVVALNLAVGPPDERAQPAATEATQ